MALMSLYNSTSTILQFDVHKSTNLQYRYKVRNGFSVDATERAGCGPHIRSASTADGLECEAGRCGSQPTEPCPA